MNTQAKDVKGARGAQEVGLTIKTGKDELKLKCPDPWDRSQWQRLIEAACGRPSHDPTTRARGSSVSLGKIQRSERGAVPS